MFRFFRRAQDSKKAKARKSLRPLTWRASLFETLEGRSMLSGLSVTNLNDSGPGSLRQAIIDANSAPTPDTISFAVAGTINLTSGALPNITGPADIDGTTVPGFAGQPLVGINFNQAAGLTFNSGALGSELRALSLTNANGNGVTLDDVDNVTIAGNYIGINLAQQASANAGHGIAAFGSDNIMIGGREPVDRNVISANNANGVLLAHVTDSTVAGNYIGVGVDGTNDLGNTFDGIKLELCTNITVGNTDAVSSIDYYSPDLVGVPVSGWQGITGGNSDGTYLISGTSGASALVFDGTIEDVGTPYTFAYPSSNIDNTSAYSTDNLGSGNVRTVGTYKNQDYATAAVEINGFVYTGPMSESGFLDSANYQTINYPGAKYNIVHSTDGGLVVGNYDSPADHGSFGLPFGPGHAFIYDVNTDAFIEDVQFPGSTSNSAYGIWFNGGTSYTIVGGYSNPPASNFTDDAAPIGNAYMVDYDSATGEFTHWKSFSRPGGVSLLSHFQGISSVEAGVYTLGADSAELANGHLVEGSFVTVRRNADGTFGDGEWVDLNDSTLGATNADSVYGNAVVGIDVDSATANYQAYVNVGFQLSNVISGNNASGISLFDSDENTIGMNYIGTDVSGTLDVGNSGNGIVVSVGSEHNLIGGEATGGNAPTKGTFVVPPQGNLISGNNANGVLINIASNSNQLSGNFIGTNLTGNVALSNTLDGVAIEDSHNNGLLGTTFQQNPFVFYNVIGGNGGNGLRVTNANDTTIQANFFGLGANNDSAVGNTLNGVLVEGSSTRTTMGGPIPLGNGTAANGQNGIFVKDTASYFVSYNTFAGVAAFSPNTTLGNARDGMLITSSGGHNLFRTNVVSMNGDDGIEVSGSATDVQVVDDILGLNWSGIYAMGNGDAGIEVGGNASNITIGGHINTLSVDPHNVISGNKYGVKVIDTAHDIAINHSFIGPDVFGVIAHGNTLDGIYLGPGTYHNIIGSTETLLRTLISGNLGDGIEIRGSNNNTVIASEIGTDVTGLLPLGNHGNGILIAGNLNVIGGLGADRNRIAYNWLWNIYVESGIGNIITPDPLITNTSLIGINTGGTNSNQSAPFIVTSSGNGAPTVTTGISRGPNGVTIQVIGNLSTLLGSIRLRSNSSGAGNGAYSFQFST